MKKERLTIQLPEGKFQTDLIKFEESDRKRLREAYLLWRKLCEKLNELEARSVNLPEGLSEGAFCLEMNTHRMTKGIPKANTSFDCYDYNRKKRIQVKACSVLPDLTSFGPKSVWDELYFVDFYRKGLWDGCFDIYLIEEDTSIRVNKGQTVADQQGQGRRPRFSIYKEIIEKKSLKPIKTGCLFLQQK
ncbi:MAG: Bsp6I family type II restriction endonuclease [Vampirovibrionales bacterium]